MVKNKELSPRQIRTLAYNVYCGYLVADHNILRTRRIMCSPFVNTDRTTFSNPHQRSWSQLQAKGKGNTEHPLDKVLGAFSMAVLFLLAAFA